ncbi:hypothetical protein [Metabacillus sp. Hm71]|uniref:hypothetical protein n=1 Tax=Metabacillus sp. Hm71 TaxID=3450743 RepID=UPI003F4366AB
MKAYYVYSWEGEYEQYMEDDKKYFLNKESALNYEFELLLEYNKIKAKHGIHYVGGVILEEIEIIED